MYKSGYFSAALWAFVAALLFAPVAYADPGDLYISASPLVLKLPFGGSTTGFSIGTLGPSGLAFDRDGNLFAADAILNRIVKLTPNGTQTTFLGSGLNAPQGLAFDMAGNLYVADAGTNSILKVTPGAVVSTFASGLNAPRGLAFDYLGTLFVANSGDDTVVKITTDGVKSTFASTGLDIPFGLAFDPNGVLFVSNKGNNTIVKISALGAVSTFLSTGLNSPEGLVFNAGGTLFVANNGTGTILGIDVIGTVSTLLSSLLSPQFLALAPSVHQFYNISTRGFVQTGNHVLIAGLIVRSSLIGDLGSMNVLVRAIGPELTGFGIGDALADPTLELYNASGQLIASNNDWKSAQQSAIEATGLAPHDDHDAAILASLPDGNYTAVVKGANGTMGTALVEAYNTGL